MSLPSVCTMAEGKAECMKGRSESLRGNAIRNGKRTGPGKRNNHGKTTNIGIITRVIFGKISLISSSIIRNACRPCSKESRFMTNRDFFITGGGSSSSRTLRQENCLLAADMCLEVTLSLPRCSLQHRAYLVQVIDIMSRQHFSDPSDRFFTAFGVHAVILPHLSRYGM